MKVQNIGLAISAILLLVGLLTYDIALSLIALLGIALSGWGFVYPDRANVIIYKVQSNFAKDKLEKELKEYQQQLKKSEYYIDRFASTFNTKFPLQWMIDFKGNVVRENINELTEDKLKEPFYHFKELLQDEGIDIPDYVVQLYINYKIDQMRFREFEEYFDEMLVNQNNPHQAIKIYAKQIGKTAAEMQYINKIFTIDYLLHYLVSKYSTEDIELQLGIDLTAYDKAKSSIQSALQRFSNNIERERRVNTMRCILHGKIMPSAHKDIKSWLEQGSKAMEDDLKELFNRMGYEVREPSTSVQGIDFILKKAGKKIAIKNAYAAEGTIGVKTIQETYAGKAYWGCDAGIVAANTEFSKEAIEMASKLEVEVWDNNTLQKLLDKYWNQDVEYWNLLKDYQRNPVGSKEEQESTLQSVSNVN
ncbi:restriction endonuclease [Desulfuribacillus alkaliarsenatis]|uniref:Restriction endonuclease type IV Mrr domain-containing protein n=1 Tax=Desulfuribacillus alkaliarsenatis TaxID=766136 RepID=A0A1E5G5T2_9FIRM|nr:restriction endonuclease [Desulfuribacillus alkaliarsenatis]OEF98513.1 hypothetical protein BHF68_02290 [Desulfuribacillus alkaliarsenatis]